MGDNSKALQIVPGSLTDIVKSNTSLQIADAFMDITGVCIIDVSGSMLAQDSRDGLSRYQVACQELAKLQQEHPGKYLVMGFSDEVKIHPNGVPEMQGSGTNMLLALKAAKEYDVSNMSFFLISDGAPDWGTEEDIVTIGQAYKNHIHTIYVGPADDSSGSLFLQRLADATGSKFATADRVKELAATVEVLQLTSGGQS